VAYSTTPNDCYSKLNFCSSSPCSFRLSLSCSLQTRNCLLINPVLHRSSIKRPACSLLNIDPAGNDRLLPLIVSLRLTLKLTLVEDPSHSTIGAVEGFTNTQGSVVLLFLLYRQSSCFYLKPLKAWTSFRLTSYSHLRWSSLRISSLSNTTSSLRNLTIQSSSIGITDQRQNGYSSVCCYPLSSLHITRLSLCLDNFLIFELQVGTTAIPRITELCNLDCHFTSIPVFTTFTTDRNLLLYPW
jgi:hypothetical protein